MPVRPLPPKLLLMGLRCSGKSTLAPILAKSLSRVVVEIDDRVAQRAGLPTAGQALALLGERAFRLHEYAALAETLDGTAPCVISLGGGTPTAPNAAELISAARRNGSAAAVYLRPTREALVERLLKAADRPRLRGTDSASEVDRLLAERDDLYLSLADAVVDPGRGRELGADAVLSALSDAGFRTR